MTYTEPENGSPVPDLALKDLPTTALKLLVSLDEKGRADRQALLQLPREQQNSAAPRRRTGTSWSNGWTG